MRNSLVVSPMPPYNIYHDSASKMIHDKAHSEGKYHLDRVAPTSYEETESPHRPGVLRAKGCKELLLVHVTCWDFPSVVPWLTLSPTIP